MDGEAAKDVTGVSRRWMDKGYVDGVWWMMQCETVEAACLKGCCNGGG